MADNSKIVENVLTTCGELENVLNNVLLKHFAELHNIDHEFNKLKLKQEVIADSGLFLTKKKYGLHIINKETKQVDEYDNKGLSLRRSNYPAWTKTKLQTLLDLLLKSDFPDFNIIDKYISDVTQEAYNLCEEHKSDIAGAVSFSQELDDYKVIPSQVKAMQLWNNLEYEYFIPGTKGKLFRILGIDRLTCPDKILKNIELIGIKNTSIVIPYEEDELPSYYILDIDAQMKFCWLDRVDEIMKVVKLENEESDLFSAIFE